MWTRLRDTSSPFREIYPVGMGDTLSPEEAHWHLEPLACWLLRRAGAAMRCWALAREADRRAHHLLHHAGFARTDAGVLVESAALAATETRRRRLLHIGRALADAVADTEWYDAFGTDV